MELAPISIDDVNELQKYKDISQSNLVEVYSKCSDNYDTLFSKTLGYPDPYKIAELMLKYQIPKDSRILDFGCGTGLVGQVLLQHGYSDISGIDACSDMLKKAKDKGYKELKEVFLMQDEFPQEYIGKFDVVVSAGFLGHDLPTEVIDEKLKCLREKENGTECYIVFSARQAPMENEGYCEKLQQLEEKGQITLIEKIEFKRYERLEDYNFERKPLDTYCYVYKA